MDATCAGVPVGADREANRKSPLVDEGKKPFEGVGAHGVASLVTDPDAWAGGGTDNCVRADSSEFELGGASDTLVSGTLSKQAQLSSVDALVG